MTHWRHKPYREWDWENRKPKSYWDAREWVRFFMCWTWLDWTVISGIGVIVSLVLMWWRGYLL